jgi:DNA repair exonuclease SbcCD ATPase subunit
MNTTDLKAAMMAEAKSLRARIAELRDQRDALTASADRVERQYHAACGTTGHPLPEAEPLHRQLQELRSRLNRGEEERRDAEQRLADLDRALGADEAAAAATKALRQAQEAAQAAAAKIVTNAEAVTRMVALRDDELGAASRARAQLAAIATAALPEDVRQLLGTAAVDPGEPVGDAAGHETRARAIGEAIDKAMAIGEQLRRDLGAAHEAEEAATVELLRQRAYLAEIAHAVALAQYLPVLATFRAAHDVAFGFVPQLPDYRRHADESHGQAMQAARDAAQPKVEAGLMGRVGRLVQRLK